MTSLLDRPDDVDTPTPPRRRLGRPTRGRLVTAGLVVALVLVVGMSWKVIRGDAAAAASDARTATVDTGDVTASVTASGNVAAATTTDVSFEGEGGTVTAILVEPGQRVRKGQVIARVDPTSAEQSLASAQTQLSAAIASLDEATGGATAEEQAQNRSQIDQAEISVTGAELSLRQAKESQRLTIRQQDAAVTQAEVALTAAQANGTGVAEARSALEQARSQRASSLLQARQQVENAQQQLTSARSSLSSTRTSVAVSNQPADESVVASAQAQVDAARISVDEAQDAVDDTVLRAPVGGTVSAVNGEVGQPSSSTSSGDSTSTTTTSGFVTLTSARVLEVLGYVAEADVSGVEVGQDAVVTLSATDRTVAGTVTEIDTTETITNNVVEYGVTVRLDEWEDIRLGQSSELTITTGSATGVTRVTANALTTIGERTTATVRADDGSEQQVAVETGITGGGSTEVLSGLEPGDVVVLPGTGDSDTGFTFPGGGGAPGGGFGGPQ